MHWPEETDNHENEKVCSATSDRLRVLVAEDNRLVAEALMFSLDTDPKLEAIGYALNGWEALEYIETLDPDVVLVGPRLRGLDPIGFCQFTHELFPNVLLIMLCERLIPAAVESAYAVGVADCLPMARSVDELLRAISDAQTRREVFERGRRQAARRPLLDRVRLGEVDARS
jgi:DNA-binding NarL/FixJ family response regulator